MGAGFLPGTTGASGRGRRAGFLPGSSAASGRGVPQSGQSPHGPLAGSSAAGDISKIIRAGGATGGKASATADISKIIAAGEKAGAAATQALKKIGETAAREIAKGVENGAREAGLGKALPPGEKTEAPPTRED